MYIGAYVNLWRREEKKSHRVNEILCLGTRKISYAPFEIEKKLLKIGIHNNTYVVFKFVLTLLPILMV